MHEYTPENHVTNCVSTPLEPRNGVYHDALGCRPLRAAGGEKMRYRGEHTPENQIKNCVYTPPDPRKACIWRP